MLTTRVVWAKTKATMIRLDNSAHDIISNHQPISHRQSDSISSTPRIPSQKTKTIWILKIWFQLQKLFKEILIKCRNFSQKEDKKGNLIQLKFVEIRHKKKERDEKKFTQSYLLLTVEWLNTESASSKKEEKQIKPVRSEMEKRAIMRKKR